MITLHDVEQGSELWHAIRDPLYTGSHADKLLKFGAIEYTRAESKFGGNFWTERGHILETEAIEIYQQIVGSVGIRMESGRKVGFVTNSRYPTCGYSPDDLYPDNTVEVKAFDEPHHLQLINAKKVDDIPLKVVAQCYFGLLITGKKICHLLPYNPNLPVEQAFKIITIKAKPAVLANLRRQLAGRKEQAHANT